MIKRNCNLIGENETKKQTSDFMNITEPQKTTTRPTRLTLMITRGNTEQSGRDVYVNDVTEQRTGNGGSQIMRRKELIHQTQLRVHRYDSTEIVTKPETYLAIPSHQEEFRMDIKMARSTYHDDAVDIGVPI